METGTWYYASGEAQHGPLTADQIASLLRERTITRDTFVWSPAMSDWAPLGQTELAALIAPPPRPPVTPRPAPHSPPTVPVGPASMGAPLQSSPTAAAIPSHSLESLTGGKLARVDLGAMEQGEGFPAVVLRAARTCIQDKYIDFQGRAGRPEFWWYQLFAIVVLIVAQILDAVSRKIIGFGLLYLLLALALCLPSLGASVRRLHDTNRSGWWLLLSLVPIVGGIVVIVFLCLPGEQGDNRYGPPPRPV